MRRHRFLHKGMSLVEVIVASVLLAGMTMASITSMAAHRTRMSEMQTRASTIEATDRLVNQLIGRREGLPCNEAGTYVDNGGEPYHWRAELIDERTLCGVAVEVIRMTVSPDESLATRNEGFEVQYIRRSDAHGRLDRS